MIRSFYHSLAEDIFHNRKTKDSRRFPQELYNTARRKLFAIHYAVLLDELRAPPGNHLEKKQGDLRDYWGIRINSQWRIIFHWDGQDAHDVQIIDYH